MKGSLNGRRIQVRNGLRRQTVRTVDDVIAELTVLGDEIVRERGPGDGVGWFNLLYLEVTRAVRGAIAQDEFTDGDFIARLDVAFAELYFDAIEADGTGTRLPKAWQPLFEKRAERGIAPIQFAFAGMNAHINHDLPIALVRTWSTTGTQGSDDAYEDFVRINDVLERVQEQVKTALENEAVRRLDADLGRVDDVLAAWSVAHARAHAWTTADALWDLQGIPHVDEAMLALLDRLVGYAGHGLLQPVGLSG